MRSSRRRYLSFQLHSDGSIIDDKQVSMAIWKSLLSLYGEVSASDSKLYLVEYDGESGTGVLQCTSDSLNRVITAAALIGSIGSSLVSFEPRKTSGTIKGLKRK